MKILQIIFSPLCWICKKINKSEETVETISSLRDSLTGLYSTDYFQEKMEHEQARFKRYEASFALILIKLDGINDSNLKSGGWEKKVKQVGEIILSELRTVDVVARYGPVVFAALLPETKILHARFVAERLRVTIKDKCAEAAGTDVDTTVCASVGEQLPEHSIENLKKRVESALVNAQKLGPDRVGIASDNSGNAEFEHE